jgi:hypothetical protein
VGDAADREQLVGPAGRVDGTADVVGVDDVVELAADGVPEPRERGAGAAWISTGLPIRAVTQAPSTRASIQVSWTPGSPHASRPSSSARMPWREPAR